MFKIGILLFSIIALHSAIPIKSVIKIILRTILFTNTQIDETIIYEFAIG